MQELDVNSDATIGSVPNGIHRSLFWHDRTQNVESFLFKICQENGMNRQTAKLDRNDGKEIKCDFKKRDWCQGHVIKLLFVDICMFCSNIFVKL